MSSNKIMLAQQLAKHFHKWQKYGVYDYYEYHLKGVVEILSDIGLTLIQDDITIVALLHDIVEDTSCEIETIENIFGFNIAQSVGKLTKIGLPHKEYLSNILLDDNARLVKFADSLFNYRECMKAGDLNHAEKYRKKFRCIILQRNNDTIKGYFIMIISEEFSYLTDDQINWLFSRVSTNTKSEIEDFKLVDYDYIDLKSNNQKQTIKTPKNRKSLGYCKFTLDWVEEQSGDKYKKAKKGESGY